MPVLILAIIVVFTPLKVFSAERLELFFDEEKDGLVEVFYLNMGKAKTASEYSNRSGYPIHPGVDPLDIATRWGRANLGGNANVESIHLWNRTKGIIKVNFYLAKVSNYFGAVLPPYIQQTRTILILPHGDVLTGEWVNSKEYFEKFEGQMTPNQQFHRTLKSAPVN